MPFDNEIATGESLIALEKSAALRDFEGTIAVRSDAGQRDDAPVADVPRTDWLPRRVIAIDGSSVTQRVQNGFPGAECSLVMLSVVFIDISKLAGIGSDEIPSPRIFHEMDRAHTLDAVLPGSNVVRTGDAADTPRRYFRATVFDALGGRLDEHHETLVETMRRIAPGRSADIECPVDDCHRRYAGGRDAHPCGCPRAETMFETDTLRFHERFNDVGPNGEVHGEVRHVLEVLSLVNILRFFEKPERIHFLRDCVFVLDGPLAVFGQPAWLAPLIRAEIMRISASVRAATGGDLLVMGVEKSGQYVAHFEDLDWTDADGPRSRFAPGTALIPDARYVNRNIVFRPEASKPSGVDTYFGRKVFYKTRAAAHVLRNPLLCFVLHAADPAGRDTRPRPSGQRFRPSVGGLTAPSSPATRPEPDGAARRRSRAARLRSRQGRGHTASRLAGTPAGGGPSAATAHARHRGRACLPREHGRRSSGRNAGTGRTARQRRARGRPRATAPARASRGDARAGVRRLELRAETRSRPTSQA